MADKEQENFCRNAILIVDHAKDSLVDVLELHLTLKSLSFEDFINLHQHDIYHLCFNKKKCSCQCTKGGYVLPDNRVLHPSQLEMLLDKSGVTRPCHVPKKSADFCCCLAKPGVTTNVLDITLARCLLINFCDDVFWHSCLKLRSNTLEDFLNQNQHHLYHLAKFNTPCCRCPPGYVFPVACPLLKPHQWNFLFNALALKCALHQNILSSNICWVFASSGIAVIDLSKDLSRTILEQCCSLWKSINTLLQMRNDFGHAKEGRITDANYRNCNNKIGSAILDIAKVCGNETEKKQILMDVEKRSLDGKLCIQYHNTLLEQIDKESQLVEKLDDLAEKMPEIVEKAVVKALDGDTKQKLTKDQQIRKEKLKEITKNCIQTHITEETFVKTNVITEGLQKLNENGIVILTGIPGIGKSRNSRELLRTFCTENQDYSAIWLQSISEWRELINADDNLIVLIDDVFGQTNSTFDGNEDLKLLDIIYSTIQKGTVKVILTMRNTIKLSLSGVVDSHRMLKAVHFLDISSDRLQMTTDEKKACLLNLCKKNNIWKQKSCTKKINCEDIAILDPDVYLSRKQIRDIAEINFCPLLGFPESCYLFASNRKFTRQGVAFFKHPTQTLCDEISNIRTLGKQDDSKALEYAILVYIMLNGDCFDRLKINCEKVKQVIESIYGPSRIELTTMKIKKCVDLLMGRYLKLKEDNTVCFQHRTTFESVLLSFKDDDPELVISLLDEECLLELGCLENYKPLPGEVTFKFYSESYKQLASQLVTYLKLESSPDYFIKSLCSSRIIRYGDKSMLEEFYNAYKNSKVDFYVRMMWLEAMEVALYYLYEEIPFFILLKYMLRYSINFTDNNNVIIDILDLVSKEMNVCNAICVKERYTCCFTDALLQSCNSNNIARLNAILNLIKTRRIKLDKKIISLFDTKRIQVNTLKLLVTTLKDCELIDVNVLMKVVVALDEVSLVYFIIEQYKCKSNYIQSVMNTACVKGAVNIVRSFCENDDVSVIKMQSLLLTVCERGHIKIVKYLLGKLKYKMVDLDAARSRLLLLTACEHGHIEIVKLLLDNLEHTMFDLDAAKSRLLLLTACEHGHIEIVKLLLDNLEHTMFDLDAAMKVSMEDYVDIAYVLLTSSTNHSFKVKEIMDTIPQHCYLSNEGIHKDCFILVKYLLETCSISNFDQKVVIQIAGSSRDSDILQLVFQMMDINDFYQIWIKAEHFENHRTIVLERLFGSGCCTDKDVLTLMNTEMRHHNINGIKYLMKTFDWKYFDIKTVIEYSFCGGHGDSEFLLWMLKTFDHCRFYMHSILEMALKHESWDVVEWILENIEVKMLDIKLVIQSVTKYSKSSKLSWILDNFDNKLFDLQSMMTSACTFDNISLVRSMIDRFGIERFQSRHTCIMQFAIRNLNNGCSDIVKLCLKNPLNIGEYNMIELFNMACRHNGIELIEWLLVHCDHVHFNFNSAFTETLKGSGYYRNNIEHLKLLLIKLDHKFLDIESIIQDLCRRREFDMVMWMLDTFDPYLVDIRSVMSMACQHGELHLVQCIIRQYGIRMFTIKSIFDDACKSKSSSVLKWLYQNFENSHICNLNNFRNYSFRNIIFLIENREMNTSDYNAIFNHFCQTLYSEIYMEFLTCLFDTMDHMLFDLKLVFNHVCRYGTMDYVKWMVKAFDNTLFDFQSAILEAVENDNFELVTFLLIPARPNVDVNSVFLEACYHNNVELVNWLLDTFDHRMFSISEGISRSCSQCGCKKFIMNLIKRCKHNLIDFNIVIQAADDEKISFTFVKRLMEIADNSTVDIPFIMLYKACNRSHPDWDFVKFMLTTYDYKVDMKLIFNSACRTGTPEIVKWLLDDYGRGMFDLKSGFNEACCEGRLDIVKLLVGSVGTENCDLQSAVQLTMNKDKIDVCLQSVQIVKYLLNKIQPSVFDLQYVMDKMCPTGNTVFVKWLIKSFDCSKLDLNSTIGMIFDEEHHFLKVLELLLHYFGHERFDMTSIIIRANHSGYREVISMMIKTVNHSFFDMKTVLLEICKEGNLETVMNLIETWHCKDLVDEAFILNAFRTGSSDIVKWLLHQRQGEIIDTKTAMSNACIGGHAQLVQYLLVEKEMDNVKLFDLRSAINEASFYGRTEVVQLFLQRFHYETFDMDSVMYHAHDSGNIGLVKWLLGVYDQEIFNIESSVIEDVKNEMAELKKKKEEEDEEKRRQEFELTGDVSLYIQ